MRLWVLPASGLAGASALQRSADPPALDSDGASLAAQLTNVKESIIFLAKEATDADKAAKYYQDKLAAEIVDGGKLDQVTLDVEQKELERNHISEWETELAQVLFSNIDAKNVFENPCEFWVEIILCRSKG
jgi:hypothetical protein